jgi:hypothetical protein
MKLLALAPALLLALAAVPLASASLGCAYAGVAGACDDTFANGTCDNGVVIAYDQVFVVYASCGPVTSP